ncbi:MAG: hypothetical protein ACRD2H_11495 [Terriglobales bacterium]
MKLLARFLLWLITTRRAWLGMVHRSDLHQPCPACGSMRKQRIRYAPEPAAVVHSCRRCDAIWPEPPQRKAKEWDELARAAVAAPPAEDDQAQVSPIEDEQAEAAHA